jgi:hypothetical protein
MSTIGMVPREEVNNVWHIVSPMIERAIEYAENRADIIDVFTEILQRKLVLWAAFSDSKEIVGCAITRLVSYPLSRILVFEYLAGENVDTWLDEGADILNNYAFDQQCDWMECRGRFGWVPRLKKYNWEAKAVFFERRVTDPAKVEEKEEL